VAAGENMPPPNGWIDKNNYQVAVRDEPVVMRTYMPNPAGGSKIPRGIAVGLPGLVSYCFDADTCTLRYAWSGGFLDMKPSWAGRGGNIVQVLGKRFYENSSFPFRVGDDKHVPKLSFQGYELVEGLPAFLFTMDGIKVRETIKLSGREGSHSSLMDIVEIEPSDKVVYLVAPADRDVPFERGTVETLRRGETLKLGEKPEKISFIIPLKETK
jgi:hypothetical protein